MTIDLRLVHAFVRHAVWRIAYVLSLVGALVVVWTSKPLGWTLVAIALAMLAVIAFLVRPIVATPNGLTLGRTAIGWERVSAPRRIPGRVRIAGYSIAFAWVWASWWRPVLLCGEPAWILAIARIQEKASIRAFTERSRSQRAFRSL